VLYIVVKYLSTFNNRHHQISTLFFLLSKQIIGIHMRAHGRNRTSLVLDYYKDEKSESHLEIEHKAADRISHPYNNLTWYSIT
jgi:hypothetical protein